MIDSALPGGETATEPTVEHPTPPTGTSVKTTRNSAAPFGARVTGLGAGPACSTVRSSLGPAPAPEAPEVP